MFNKSKVEAAKFLIIKFNEKANSLSLSTPTTNLVTLHFADSEDLFLFLDMLMAYYIRHDIPISNFTIYRNKIRVVKLFIELAQTLQNLLNFKININNEEEKRG